MEKLKEILDNFGWENIQQGRIPPEIKPERDKFIEGIHQYDLYALNGVCVIVEDEANIVELSGIAKTSFGYERRARIPMNTTVRTENVAEFLADFKHLHGFRNRFIFVKEENMHFDGIGKRLEEAGQLYHS
jgi:hypothetical protein